MASSSSSSDTELPELPEVLYTILANQKKIVKTVITPSRKRRHVDVTSPHVQRDDEDGMTCSVCLDVWTSSGAHRLCALKCGHLFGKSCVTRWLSGKQKVCPQCNTPARKNDVRELYANKLVAVDTTELEDLRLKCSQLQAENVHLQTTLKMQEDLVAFYKVQCEKQTQNIEANISKQLKITSEHELFKPRALAIVRLDGQSRVMAYCTDRNVIAISQEHLGPLWPGYGVRLASTQAENLSAHQPIHKKEMRDMAFHPRNPDLLLTVSFDQYVKVTDITNKKTVFAWLSQHRLWSCCWDSELQDVAYVGTERGHVIRLSTENTNASTTLPFPCDSPVGVIALFSSRKLRSLICCRLLSVSSYSTGGDHPDFRMLRLQEGKFCAMAVNESSLDDDVILVLTCRPEGSSTSVRHICCKLRRSDDGYVLTQQHVFSSGSAYSQLFRPSLISSPQGPLFFSYNESASMVVGWNIGDQDAKKVVSIKVHDLARHLITTVCQNQLTLYILMPTLLKSYTMNIQ